MEIEYWYEIFKTNENGSTETVDLVDTKQEAIDYINQRPNDGLKFDKWQSNSDGTDIKQSK